jgi:hypothetical protein
MSSNIKVVTFTGASIRTYIPSIAKLRTEVFREYPFLYAGDTKYENKYLKKLTRCKDAIAVLIFDGPKIVGSSIGLPLEEEAAEIQQPFLENGHNPADYFYLGDSVLLKPYRSRGLGHHFFDLREAHVKHLKRFQHICFCTVVRPKNHPRRPKEPTISLEQFWKKRGYAQHPKFKCFISWRDLDEEKETPKPRVFWIKENL